MSRQRERRSRRPAPETAEHVDAAPDVRKTVTVVAVEFATSSAGADGLDPEALRRVSGRAFGEAKAAIERHGGTIEAVSGDAVTGVFGLPVVHEDDAVRGVRAALEARDALLALGAELAAETALRLDGRVGVSTGEVIAGGDGLPQPRATGVPLTVASRLVRAAGTRPGRRRRGHAQAGTRRGRRGAGRRCLASCSH